MQDSSVPLCIDCDGTLIRTDLLHEMVFRLLKAAPWLVLWLPIWLLRGKAHLKDQMARRTSIQASTLPVRQDVLDLARAARAAGRTVVLATASPSAVVQPLADHLQCFDEVIASDSRVNMAGQAKRAALVERYGEKGYDYAGDTRADLAVWASARRALVISSDPGLARAASRVAEVERVIKPARPGLGAYLRALRLHQWLKNLLVLVPLFAAHQMRSATGLGHALLAFAAFSLCASAVYVLNDLLDLESDRRHVRKRQRPFASGLVPISHGALLVPLLLAASVAVAWSLPAAFLGVLGAYFVCTLAYSVVLKRQVIVDVLMLAGLYTLRVIAGGAATGIVPSFWLLAFSMFLFLSLALVKRYSEMLITLQQQAQSAAGRGYTVQDLPVLMSVGTSSGLVAVMVFALYINNPDLHTLYSQPLWLWLVPPLLLYWISRIWMKAHRSEVDDDPVVFAARDWQSLTIVTIMVALFLLAH